MSLNSNSAACVFPGQGSQQIGMGRDLAEEYTEAGQVFSKADTLLGYDLSGLMWNGPVDKLNDTVHTQPALYVHSIAAWRVLVAIAPDFHPKYLAGHSLGELSALTAAGAMPFDVGLSLVRTRGELMKRAGEFSPGGMAAVLGLDIPTLEKVCNEASSGQEIVQVANDNCPGQVVISGARAGVDRAIEAAKAAGAKRAIPLAVSIAAHSPLMESIQEEWNQAVDACQIEDPDLPVVGNVNARVMRSAKELRADIKAQMDSRVRWTESVGLMLESGIDQFIEVGSGSVLLGLIRRITASMKEPPPVSGQAFGTAEDAMELTN
jgi:[acyl-carrier-protein] S-malonyltransferase